MSLSPGAKLGSYEILAAIGKGGMGEVYSGRDAKLGREVAIKVLPEEFTQHPHMLARFEREARFLATLNHPGIATLYGVEEFEDEPFLVMELVEGETLAERIARGPLPINEALTLSQQIAEALEAAHEKGVIHRDLKPSNIKVDAEGHVKVLDFGLAKLAEPEGDSAAEGGSQSPTLSRDATRGGVILGTAVYMSPEQARGKAIDKRTDIFSFGAVLYEMLSGKKAFRGEDVSDVLAAVIRSEPDWKALPADVPPSVVKLLRRCLMKDRKKRLQAIGDARNEIEEIRAAPATDAASARVQPRATVLLQATAGVLVVALLATLWALWPTVSAPEQTVRLSVKLGAGNHQLAQVGGIQGSMVVLSPDGNALAFVGLTPNGNNQLYLRSLDSLEATALSGTEGAAAPFFSPDGQWLAFFAFRSLKKVSVSGGAAVTLSEISGAGVGGTWGPDETIIYAVFAPELRAGLYRVPASGGTPVELTTTREDEAIPVWPWFLPNGKAVLFSVPRPNGLNDATIEAVLLESGERKVLLRGGTYPRFLPSGYLLYMREATLFAIPFDADRIETTGEPSPVIEGVLTYTGAGQYAFSGNGSLVYVPAAATLEEVPRELVRVDRQGNTSPLTETLGDWESPRFSPDGQRIAVRRMEATGGTNQDVWMLALSRGTLTRLTFGDGLRPMWSPDGQTVFFASLRSGPYTIFSTPADGSGPAEEVMEPGPIQRFPGAITSDGKTIVFRQGGGVENLNIGMVRLEGDREPEMLLETSFNEHTPKLSPDDRWLAYVSDESGRDEIYVTRFPRGGKWQISIDGGTEPMWSRESRELFYRNGEKMMAVDVSAGVDKAGKPALLFEGPFDLKDGPGATNYDVTPDGQGFVMVRAVENRRQSGRDSVTLVLNWFQELERLAPTH